jgi:hypothetical protein
MVQRWRITGGLLLVTEGHGRREGRRENEVRWERERDAGAREVEEGTATVHLAMGVCD